MALFNNIQNKIYDYEKKNGSELLTSCLNLLKISLTNTNFDKLLYSIITQIEPKNKLIKKYYLQFNNYVLKQDCDNFNKIYKIFLNKNKKIKKDEYILYKDIIERSIFFMNLRDLKNFEELYESIVLYFISEKIKNKNEIKIPYEKIGSFIDYKDIYRDGIMYSFIIFCQTYFKINDKMILDIKESPYNIYIDFEKQLHFHKDNNKVYDNDIINYSFSNKLCFNSNELNGRKNYDYLRFIKDNEIINNIYETNIYNKILELFEINKLMTQDNTNFRNLDFLNIIQTIPITKIKITRYFNDYNEIIHFLMKVKIIDYVLYRYYFIITAHNAESTNNMSKILWIILIGRFYLFHTSLNYEDFVFKIKKYLNHILNIYIIYISNIINYNKTNKLEYKISTLIYYYNNLLDRLFESYITFCDQFFSIDKLIINKNNDNLNLHTIEYKISTIERTKYIQNIYKNYLIYLILQKNNKQNYIPFIYNIIISHETLFINYEKIHSDNKFEELDNMINNKNIQKKGLQLLNIINTEAFVNFFKYKRIDIILNIIYKMCEMLQDIQNTFTFFSHNNLNLFNIYYDINLTIKLKSLYINNCYLVNLDNANFCYNNIYCLSSDITNHDECLQNESFYNTIDLTQFLYKYTYTLMETINKENNLKNKILKYICKTSNNNYIEKVKKNITNNLQQNNITNDIIKQYEELIKPNKLNEFIFTKIFSFKKENVSINDNIDLISTNPILKKNLYKSLQENNEVELLDFSEINIKFTPQYILNIINDYFSKMGGVYFNKLNKVYS
jgi:hypothetical protein